MGALDKNNSFSSFFLFWLPVTSMLKRVAFAYLDCCVLYVVKLYMFSHCLHLKLPANLDIF